MKYTVTWTEAALDELATIWSQADDRVAVTAASNEIDRLLGASPYTQGESRRGNVRVMFEGSLGADFAVFVNDRIVQVLTVWRVKGSHGKTAGAEEP